MQSQWLDRYPGGQTPNKSFQSLDGTRCLIRMGEEVGNDPW